MSDTRKFQVGDKVKLVLPTNEFIDGAEGVIEKLEDWGAHILTPDSGSGRYRALFSEMIYLGGESVLVVDSPPKYVTNGAATKALKAAGFTGDICPTCGGCSMVRNGTCLLCTECGGTTGCS